MSFSLEDVLRFLAEDREKAVYKRERLGFYRDLLDSELNAREFAILRCAQLERRESAMQGPMERIARSLSEGKTVADSLKAVAPAADVAILAAFERQNRLDQGLEMLVSVAKQETALRTLIRASLVKPVVYLVMAFLMISIGIPTLVSQLGPLLASEARSWDQRLLIGFAGFMSQWVVVLGAFVVGVVTLAVATLPRWTGSLRRWVDVAVPAYGMYRAYHAAIFLQTLSVQLSVTPRLEDGVKAVAQSSTPWLRMYCERIVERLPHYRLNPLDALDVGLMDEEVVDSLSIISRKGTAEDAITRRAQTAGQSAAESIQRSVTWLQSAAIAVAGLLVVWASYSLVLGLIKSTMHDMDAQQTKVVP